MAKRSSSAAPTAAGFLFQVERALAILSRAEDDSVVAVEHLDDLSVHNGGRIVALEQDKHTVARRELLSDRAHGLWRTIQIWLELGEAGRLADRYLIVTNGPTNTPICQLLKLPLDSDDRAVKIVTALRAAGNATRSSGKLQALIDDVLGREERTLQALVSNIELVDASYRQGELVDQIANGLAFDPGVDRPVLVDNLLGWVIRSLMTEWTEGRAGIVSRKACVAQCRRVEQQLVRQRLLPRPAREVPISEQDRTTALARPFVSHLTRIEVTNDEVVRAVDQFIQFGIEKHRLALAGEVPDSEWVYRSDRLHQRWLGIRAQTTRLLAGRPPATIGQHIFESTTYDHYEPLAGEVCPELYMTAGHYHRLADEDMVWWDPSYVPQTLAAE